MKREELIAYDKWLTRHKWGTGEIISPEKAADLYLAEHPLPPAEGAEEMFRLLAKYASHQRLVDDPDLEKLLELDDLRRGVYEKHRIPTSFATAQLIAEETVFRHVVTLHAQQMAEKMVGERLREELMTYDKFLSNTYWGISHITKREEAVDEYLKSRDNDSKS